MRYKSVYDQWKNDPEKYWQNLAKDIVWDTFPKTTLNKKNKYLYDWFPDGVLNTCYNAVDKNIIQGRGNQVAIYYDSPITNTKSKITYNELKKHNAEDIIVVCGGVIPKKDYKFLYDSGVAAIFGPGTAIPEATETIINKATNHMKRMHNYRMSRIRG